MDFNESLIDFARRFLFVREAGGPNRGLWVSIFQHFTGNAPGDSWCASFVSFVLSVMFHGRAFNPYPVTASCEYLHMHAIEKGWIVETPQVGDLYFFLDATGHAHHVGFVTTVTSPVQGIAGNTSSDGHSSDGDGVHEHTAAPPEGSTLAFASYPRPA